MATSTSYCLHSFKRLIWIKRINGNDNNQKQNDFVVSKSGMDFFLSFASFYVMKKRKTMSVEVCVVGQALYI